MTVAEYLKKTKQELNDVKVISVMWKCSVVDYRKPSCGCLDDEVVKVVKHECFDHVTVYVA